MNRLLAVQPRRSNSLNSAFDYKSLIIYLKVELAAV